MTCVICGQPIEEGRRHPNAGSAGDRRAPHAPRRDPCESPEEGLEGAAHFASWLFAGRRQGDGIRM